MWTATRGLFSSRRFDNRSLHHGRRCRLPVRSVQLDAASGQLSRQQKRIHLPDSQAAILTHLVCHAGHVVSKEALMEAGWAGLAVGPNSVDQAISRLRRLLGGGCTRGAYIETLPSRGYQFTSVLERGERASPEAALAAELAPYRTFVKGHAELDSLDRHAIDRARRAFEDALRLAPDYSPAHVGLAMACGLLFEASLADAQPDIGTLELGIRHARHACELGPASAEGGARSPFCST